MESSSGSVVLEAEEERLEISGEHGEAPELRHRRPTSILERRKQQLGSLFGIRPWGHHVARKPQSSSIKNYKRAAPSVSHISAGNILWTFFFGWWISLLFILASGLLAVTVVGLPYAKLCWALKSYFFWPFGTFIVEFKEKKLMTEDSSLLAQVQLTVEKAPVVPYIVWLIVYVLVLFPVLVLVGALNWFFVATIPMAKIQFKLMKLLFIRPHCLSVARHYSTDIDRQHSMLVTYQAFNPYYFRYCVWGMNIIFVNLTPLVVFRVALIVVSMAGVESAEFLPPIPRFICDILCTVPITFYIGMAISSIAVQTNYMIGAILNASFGSMTELLLFTLAIRTGVLNDLILYSLTGSLLCDMLFLPGLSMVAGGIKYREQKFNPSAAGVSSLLLFIAVIGAFTPTIFFHMFGGYVQDCSECALVSETEVRCSGCHYAQTDLRHDALFMDSLKPLMWVSAVLLPIAYLIGMLFTFKTHSDMFFQEEEIKEESDGGPEWRIWQSVLVMCVAVACHGLIAEDLVQVLETVLHELGIKQSFMGITVIALTPAATEIANAVKFALSNQISLSVEIGSASSVQVALIQMPMLTVIAAIFSEGSATATPFNLIFPLLNVFAVILAVITFNYISTEGRTNYFVGASMIIMYLLFLSAFFFVPESALPPLPSNGTTPSIMPTPVALTRRYPF